MHHSLISRFQGALLGLALGEQWDRAAQGQRLPDQGSYRKEHYRLFQQPVPILFSTTSPSYPESLPPKEIRVSGRAIDLTRQLVQGGSATQGQHSLKGLWETSTTANQLAIVTLPVYLFYHESSKLLEQQLSQLLVQWSKDSATYQQVLLVGLVLGQILRNQFQPNSLLPCLQREWHKLFNTPASGSLVSGLETLQTLLQRRVSLQTAVDLVSSGDGLDPTIALAFYCFLSTPDQLQLALLRSARLSHQFPHISALTGMLAGAYNTTMTLSLEWQWVLTDSNCPLIGAMTGKELRRLATHLLAVWSGAEDPATFNHITPAISAPGVIRSMGYLD